MAVLLSETAALAVDSKKAQYVGGTIASATLKEGVEGVMSAADQKLLVFTFKKKEAPFTVPYDKVTSVGYGQHAGRRVGATIALGVTTLGIGALPVLFSKKRRHYLTLNFTNGEGKEEAAIFELGKDVTRTILASLKARTGKEIEYEDEEARKAGNK